MSRFSHYNVLLWSALFSACASSGWAATAFYVDGDAIGPDSTTTDNTGGFGAVLQNGNNLGQPAIQVSLTGQELLTEFRVIVFGLPGADGNLFFQEFDYRLDVWKSDDYFAGAASEFHVNLGQPVGVNLVSNGATSVVPDTPFGTAGIVGNNADTYDFRFDLTNLPAGDTAQTIFETPFAAGDWVFGFQSWHDTASNGVLRVTASDAAQGPLPLFSRDDFVPRGVLGGQDPANIGLRWGISLAAVDTISGDFDFDRDVDSEDAAIWSTSFGVDGSADADADGDTDGADFLLWQKNFGTGVVSPFFLSVPEPPAILLAIAATLCCWRRLALSIASDCSLTCS